MKTIKLPQYAHILWAMVRYIVLYGGRGSAKSHSVARALLIQAAEKKLRILCTREHQVSIKDSVHKLLKDIIHEHDMEGFYATEKTITHKNGSEFIFKGLRHNIDDIKSLEGVDICWVEEAQVVSQRSWDILRPTIRKKGSRFYITFNPENDIDPTYQIFVKNKPSACESIKVNYEKNPWFSEELRAEMEDMKRTDPERYDWVWLGNTRQISDNLVFKDKYKVESFEVDESFGKRRMGLDFGFSNDPLAFNELYIKDNCLYIRDEINGTGIETVHIKEHLRRFNVGREKIPSDNARPESISQLQHDGINAVSCKKWKGSIEDGVAFMRSFDWIIIHPDCVKTISNFNHYKYKTDRLTGRVLAEIIDKDNDHIDAIRYALEDDIKIKRGWGKAYGKKK